MAGFGGDGLGTSERVQRALRVAAVVFFLLLVVFAKFHDPTRFAHTLQKLAHPVTFGVVAVLLLTLFWRRSPRRFGAYAAAFAVTVLCGAGTEVAQAFVDRDPSLFDVLRDALGASAALAAFATLVPGEDARGRGVWRVAGAVYVVVGCAVMAAPMMICLAAYARRDLSFPVLLQACSPLDEYFLADEGSKDVSGVSSTGSTASPCGRALRVDFGTTRYAGVYLAEPYPDWRSAQALVLDVRNPGDRDLPLFVRVHDHAHTLQFRDRFNRGFVVRAHERLEIAIPIAEIEHAPAGRLMDLSRIAGVIVFHDRETMAGNFELERISLRR